MKKLRITVDGKEFEVVVEVLDEGEAPKAQPTRPSAFTPVAAPVAAPRPAPKKPVVVGGDSASVPSPLAGKVVAIDAKEGQSVAEGDTLITLEAMKMNTFVTAPHAGTVSTVCVKIGDPVEEGQELVTLS